jgi:cellulose synthase/poly-beta-1,6-N-acetylglucosamine synthase-like glycosyltransferase
MTLILFIISTVFLVVYYLFFWLRIHLHDRKKTPINRLLPISVVICAKNEEQNILDNLPYILQQDYPKFDVVVVDDDSSDDTYFHLKQLQQNHPTLQVIRLHKNVNFFKGKKFPLSIGIKSTKYAHLVLTDADCKPSSDKWLRHIAELFSDDTSIILGYGKYETYHSLLNMLIRFETMHTAMQYMSFALAGIPYMGVGRNLAYKKEIFYVNNGFSKHYNIPSGDDDLFVNSVATSKNTVVCVHHEAHTVSNPPQTWAEWFKQKTRHISTGKYYKIKHKLILGLYHVFNLLFWSTFIVLCITSNNLYVVLSLFFVKSMLYLFLMFKNVKVFKEDKLFGLSVFFELLLTIILGIIYVNKFFSKSTKWK